MGGCKAKRSKASSAKVIARGELNSPLTTQAQLETECKKKEKKAVDKWLNIRGI